MAVEKPMTRKSVVLGEYLELIQKDDGSGIICRKCGHEFCSGVRNPKESAIVKEEPLSRAGRLYVDSERFMLRQFFCPGCATLFSVDIAEKGSPILWEIKIEEIRR